MVGAVEVKILSEDGRLLVLAINPLFGSSIDHLVQVTKKIRYSSQDLYTHKLCANLPSDSKGVLIKAC